MKQQYIRAAAFGLIAFLAAWQGSSFALDYRSILGAIVSAGLGAASPNKVSTTTPSNN